jgi:glutathione S-transferase
MVSNIILLYQYLYMVSNIILFPCTALRHVAHALLVGVEAKQQSPDVLSAAEGPMALPAVPVAESARYLRDRVGVPRDLPFPAARQLRAHLNWLIDSIDP